MKRCRDPLGAGAPPPPQAVLPPPSIRARVEKTRTFTGLLSESIRFLLVAMVTHPPLEPGQYTVVAGGRIYAVISVSRLAEG